MTLQVHILPMAYVLLMVTVAPLIAKNAMRTMTLMAINKRKSN